MLANPAANATSPNARSVVRSVFGRCVRVAREQRKWARADLGLQEARQGRHPDLTWDDDALDGVLSFTRAPGFGA
jgi:hypothetical protein